MVVCMCFEQHLNGVYAKKMPDLRLSGAALALRDWESVGYVRDRLGGNLGESGRFPASASKGIYGGRGNSIPDLHFIAVCKSPRLRRS